MYAVIATGGKQYRVEEGQRVLVERLGAVDTDVELTPVMVVDGDDVLATPEALAGSSVSVRIVGDARDRKSGASLTRTRATSVDGGATGNI